MVKIIFTTPIDGFNYRTIYEVENNVAHRYIDAGFAMLVMDNANWYDDKMLPGKSKKGQYKVK